MAKKYKVILISGGFDPVHKGHIECIQNAKKLADEVWVGLNNDSWLHRKKGKSFMKEQERACASSGRLRDPRHGFHFHQRARQEQGMNADRGPRRMGRRHPGILDRRKYGKSLAQLQVIGGHLHDIAQAASRCSENLFHPAEHLCELALGIIADRRIRLRPHQA